MPTPDRGAQNPVLEDARYVLERAAHVKINEEAIDGLAREWADRDFGLPDWRWNVDMSLPCEERFDHFLVGNCLNFKYWTAEGPVYRTVWNGRVRHDADGMFASLQRAEKRGVPVLDGKFLAELTEEKAGKIFNNYGADGEPLRGEVEMPMLKERVRILNAAGGRLAEKYGGRFRNILAKTGKRVKIAEFAEFLAAEFPQAYRDVSVYKGRKIRFHKRANLAAAQAWENLLGSGCFEIADPGNSVVFADYLLPMVNRAGNCAVYSEELAGEVDGGKTIAAGSEKEIEIRAVGAVLASDMLKGRINFYRKRARLLPITNLHLDAALWSKGVRLMLKGARHHRTPTTAY